MSVRDLLKAMSINQRMEVTVWDNGHENVEYTFHSYIVDLESPFFLAAPPSRQISQISALLKPGVILGVVLDCNPAPIIFYPTVHRYHAETPSGYWLKISEDTQMEVVQRRRHVRIAMVVPARIQFQGDNADQEEVLAFTEDLSGGGMRVTSPRLFQKGEDIQVEIQFAANQPKLQLKARIVFSMENQLRRRKDDLYVTSCQFYDLENQQETILVRECFRREINKIH